MMVPPRVPMRPRISTRSAMLLDPNSGNMNMSPHFCDMQLMTVDTHLASMIMQKVPRGRVRLRHFFTHCSMSVLWCALCDAGVPQK